MTNLAAKLKRALREPSAPAQGDVIAVLVDGLVVQTRAGVQQLQRDNGDATLYRAGDRVRISGGLVKGKILIAVERYTV